MPNVKCRRPWLIEWNPSPESIEMPPCILREISDVLPAIKKSVSSPRVAFVLSVVKKQPSRGGREEKGDALRERSIYFLRNEQPSVRRALPPVGWHRTVVQPWQITTVWACEKTVVMVKQPGHFTSMKKDRGAGTRVCYHRSAYGTCRREG